MTKFICYVSTLALVGSLVAAGVQAANEANVAATVTVKNISVAVADGNVSYGTLAVNTSQDTTSTGVNETQTATNDGNVTEDLNIRGATTTSWTLSGTAGVEQYVHGFCTGICTSTSTFTSLTLGNQTLVTNLSTTLTQDFDLKITTPTATADFTEQTANVVVQAVES